MRNFLLILCTVALLCLSVQANAANEGLSMSGNTLSKLCNMTNFKARNKNPAWAYCVLLVNGLAEGYFFGYEFGVTASSDAAAPQEGPGRFCGCKRAAVLRAERHATPCGGVVCYWIFRNGPKAVGRAGSRGCLPGAGEQMALFYIERIGVSAHIPAVGCANATW